MWNGRGGPLNVTGDLDEDATGDETEEEEETKEKADQDALKK